MVYYMGLVLYIQGYSNSKLHCLVLSVYEHLQECSGLTCAFSVLLLLSLVGEVWSVSH